MGSPSAITAKTTVAKGITRQFAIRSCSLDIDDLGRLFRILQGKAAEAADEQVATLKQQEGQTDAQFSQAKDALRSLLDLVVRVQGSSGEWTAANTIDAVREESLPTPVANIQYDSSFLFRNKFNNTGPQNSFLVTLNFTRTEVLDLTNTAVAATSNQSTVGVSGANITWVNAVTQELRAFFDERSNNRGWLYSRYTYDLLVLFFGFPLSLNLVYHFDKVLRPILKLPDALFVALYVYLVLVALLGFRFLFNYAKWVFPKIEAPLKRHGAPGLHKTVLGAIALALLVHGFTSLLWVLGIHLH
jgi:hypothetical protein